MSSKRTKINHTGKTLKNGNVTDFKLQDKLLSQNQTIIAKRIEK